MRRTCPRRLVRIAALAVALAFVQAAALSHFDAADTHFSGDPCALCAGLAMLGAGNVGAPEIVDVAIVRVSGTVEFSVLVPRRRPERAHARDPPAAS